MKRKRAPKSVLKLPDLEQSKSAVLNSLTSPSSQRTYDHATREFIEWYCSEPRLAFNKTVVNRYRISLEQQHYASTTINLRLAAVRRLAYVPLRIVNRHQMIVPVSINHMGPFNFLLDTGTQMTMLDPALAATLQLSTSGTAEVASAGASASASFAQVELIEAGSRSTASQKVLVYDLKNLQATGLDIHGVLGEDFLEQFDMMIDNARSVLCLESAGTMQVDVKGQHVALLEPGHKDGSGGGTETLAHSLIILARLTDGRRPVRLKLDSGTNVPFLYNTSDYLALGLYHGLALRGGGANGSQRTFTALPAQGVKIGSADFGKLTFFTLAGAKKDSRTSDFDGLLTIGMFKRIMIDHANHFAVLEAR
jgi:hypothetical protein